MTPRQSIKVKAALAVIHASGGNAQSVNATAKAHMAKGQATAKAYELALNAYAATAPEIGGLIGRVTRLVHASDDASLAQYDAALTHYDNTGDEAGLNALAPMVDADMATLDAREASPEPEAAPAPAPAAFGFKPQQPVAPAPTASSFLNGTQTGSVANHTGYSVPKTGEALARQVGLPMAYVTAQQDQPA